jgi:hypothetical protein
MLPLTLRIGRKIDHRHHGSRTLEQHPARYGSGGRRVDIRDRQRSFGFLFRLRTVRTRCEEKQGEGGQTFQFSFSHGRLAAGPPLDAN